MAGGSESTIIVGPSKSVLVYALHSLEYVLGLARFQVFMPKLLLYYKYFLICSQQIEEDSLRRGNRTYEHRCVRPTLYLLHHSRPTATWCNHFFIKHCS